MHSLSTTSESPVPETSSSAAKERLQGEQVPFEGENGLYTQSWFPICMSAEIPAGTVKGYPFLGGRVVAFRGEDGVAQVKSAYCAHLGADLSAGGCVKGNNLVCPYHFWEYAADGNCVRTGAGDPPPPRAGLFSFPTQEAHGLIWAFNGEAPLFNLPEWPRPAQDLITDTQPFPLDMRIDPWIICAQTPDIQHVIQLHKFELIGPNPAGNVEWTEHSMFYNLHARAQGREMNVRAGIIGSSIFFQTGTLDGRWFGFMTAMGMPKAGSTTLFSVFAAERGNGDEAEVRRFLNEARDHEITIASEDMPIAQAIHFRVGSLTKSDATLAKFLRMMRAFPRAHPSADFIN